MMKNYLKNLDRSVYRNIMTIGKQADHKHLSAYIVGGIVRDIIIKRKNLDLDVLSAGDAIALAKRMVRRTKGRLKVYEAFKTATLELPNNMRIDFATTRKERYAFSGALPDVQGGTLRDDLYRRDFTINAMAISINQDRWAELVDEFGGLADLRARKIRVLHKDSFRDDPTRILRAVRFEQRFNFHMERKTYDGLKKALKNNYPNHVKPQRYFAEFKKILMEKKPGKPLQRLQQLGGLKFLGANAKINFRLICLLEGNIKKLQKAPLYKEYENWWLIFLLGIFENLRIQDIKKNLQKFSFTKEEKKIILESRKVSSILRELARPRLTPSAVYKILAPLTRDTILYCRLRTKTKRIVQRIDHFWSKDRFVELHINGNDCKKIGVSSGKRIGEVLHEVLLQKIDKGLRTKQQELRLARQLVGVR